MILECSSQMIRYFGIFTVDMPIDSLLGFYNFQQLLFLYLYQPG
jgi:hypothetical protein